MNCLIYRPTIERGREYQDGVSPIIGTILLVAITVVLVAIISAVVMGMTGGIGTSHVVGVKVVQGDDTGGNPTLLVTVTGGDVTGLSKLTVYNGVNLVNISTVTPTVGVPITFYNAANLTAGSASVSIVGTFADGDQTIYTGTINIV